MRHFPYLHFILASPPLPVHSVVLEPLEVNPVDGAHVDGQCPLHGREAHPFGVLETVRDFDAAGRTEGVFGSLGAEVVEGEVLVSVEGDVFFGGVDP